MIQINKREKVALQKAGALKYKLQPSRKHPAQEANFVTVNRQKSGPKRHTYIIETIEILAFLGRWDSLSFLQKITPTQAKMITDAGLVEENQIQRYGEYKEGAVMFVSYDGTYRIKKITELMKAAGIWK